MEAALRVRLLPLCSELVIGVVAAEPRPIGKLEENIPVFFAYYTTHILYLYFQWTVKILKTESNTHL